MTNDEKLILAAKGILPFEKTISEIARDYSVKIRDAIMPVSKITAPFVVFLLREYADEIEKIDRGVKSQAKRLAKALPREAITVKMPASAERDR